MHFGRQSHKYPRKRSFISPFFAKHPAAESLLSSNIPSFLPSFLPSLSFASPAHYHPRGISIYPSKVVRHNFVFVANYFLGRGDSPKNSLPLRLILPFYTSFIPPLSFHLFHSTSSISHPFIEISLEDTQDPTSAAYPVEQLGCCSYETSGQAVFQLMVPAPSHRARF